MKSWDPRSGDLDSQGLGMEQSPQPPLTPGQDGATSEQLPALTDGLGGFAMSRATSLLL